MIKVFFLSLIIFISNCYGSQNFIIKTTNNKSLFSFNISIDEVQQLVKKAEYLFNKLFLYSDFKDLSIWDKLLSLNCSDISQYELKQEFYELNAEEFKKDYGINFEAGYRSSTGDITLYNYSTYLGFSWNLLKGGLLENRLKEKENLYKKELLLLKMETNKRKDLYLCRNNFIVYYFANLKIPVLMERLEVLNYLYEIIRKSYFYNESLIDDGLKIEMDIYKVKNRLKYYKNLVSICYKNDICYCKIPLLKGTGYPALLEPNLSTIISSIKMDKNLLKERELMKQLVKIKKSRIHDITLRFFLNFSTKGENDIFSKNGIISGFRLSIPFKNKDNNLERLEFLMIDKNFEKEKKDRIDRAIHLYNLYEDKIHDVIVMWYRFKIAKERLRRSLIIIEEQIKSGRINLNDYIIFLKHYSDVLDVQYEFLSLEELLYRQLLYFFSQINLDLEKSFVNKVTLKSKWHRMRNGKRSIYIWSKSFEKYSFFFIENFLIAKSIDRVLVPYSVFINDDLRRFLERLKKKGINIEIILSEPTFVFPYKWKRVKRKIENILKSGYDIHLDIEPHILSNFNKNRGDYLNMFISFLKKINFITQIYHHKLTVTVTPYEYNDIISKIAFYSDEIFIMVYGKTNLNKISQIFSSIDVPPRKITLVVRAKDFKNIIEMENFFDYINSNFRISSFAIHNLRQLIQISLFWIDENQK